MIEQYKKKAFDLLATLPDSNICLALRTYLDYVVAVRNNYSLLFLEQRVTQD